MKEYCKDKIAITNSVGDLYHCTIPRVACMVRDLAELFDDSEPNIEAYTTHYDTFSTKMCILLDYLCKAESEIRQISDAL